MNDKILQIVQRCLEIQQESNFCAFFDLRGHCDWIEVSVRKSKEEFGIKLFEASFVKLDDESKLEKILVGLEMFLKGYELKPTRKYLQPEQWVEEYETVVI